MNIDRNFILAVSIILVSVIFSYFLLKWLLGLAGHPRIKSPMSDILFFWHTLSLSQLFW